MGKRKERAPPAHLALPEAPVFRPTEQEWRDPLRYIAQVVRPVVEHTSGICRVVPPADWVAGLAAEFAIDRGALKFNARVQRVDQLQRKHTAVASQRFWNEYQAWMAANGVKRKGGKLNPVFNGREIELDRFHAAVAHRGGYAAVTEDRGWREIANVLDLEDKQGNAAFAVRKLYEKLLLPFDDYCRQRAEGGFGLLDAAKSAVESETGAAAAAAAAVAAAEAEEAAVEGMDEDEAAEILSAMLGLAPPSGKKGKKKSKAADAAAAAAAAAAEGARPPPAACEKCGGGHAADRLVPCARCPKGWHTFCLAPPLEARPAGEWVCPDCRAQEFEAFAFQDADDYSLEEFEGIAATFEEQWFGADRDKLTYKDKEAEFWRIVEDGEDVVEVLYGADLDSGEVGSGFPRAPPLGNRPDSAYSTHPWNLSVMPRQSGRYSSLLRVLDGNIAGVTVPWVYVGMAFSSFCWHVEDHMFYSINYNHWGAPKQWYGVPAWAAARFEAVFRSVLKDQVEAQPDLLFQLLSMLSPRVLVQHGVPVYSATQAAGEFVITFPNSYHGGFCMGVNLGEAVNFAPADWLRFGAAALGRLRHFRKPCVVSQEEMLLRVAREQAALAAGSAASPGSTGGSPGGEGGAAQQQVTASPVTCYYLSKELRRVVDEEWVLRAKLWSEGLRRSRRCELAVGFEEGAKDDAECTFCHLYMHLSAVECGCCPGRRACLHHASHLCGCEMRERRLVYRHSMRQLEDICADVAARVPAEAAAELDSVEAAATARTAGAAAAAAEVKQEQAAAAQEGEQPKQQQQQQQQPEVKAEEGQEAPAAAAADEGKAAVEGLLQGMEADVAAAEAAAQQPAKPNVSQQAGPVRPFVSVDICPWDEAELPEWQEALRRACEQWQTDASEALTQGGAKAGQLEDLAEECEQYLWGDVSEETGQLAGRVRAAAAYMARLDAALKGKLGLEEVEALLAKEAKPVPDPPGLPKLQEGLAAAREWLGKAQPFLDESHTSDYKALEACAAEAHRIPVALPEAKVLRERAAAARKLADSVRQALPAARGEGRRRGTDQLELEDLRAFQEEAARLRVHMPEMSNLQGAMERVEVWQTRVRALTEMQAPLEELRELVEEAEGLPAAMPEVEQIQALIERAEAWRRQMRAVVANRSALKRMREVLNAGLRLPVELPELEELRGEIKRREWEDATKRALGARQNTLVYLTELLTTAAEVGAEETGLAANLREKVEVAEAWEARAADLLERQAEGVAEGSRPTLDAVSALVNEGFGIGTKMERLTQLNAQLAASITWIEEARRTLQKAADLAASQAAEEEEEDGQGEGAAGAGGGSTSAMEVDWQGTAEEVSGAPSAQAASAGPSQGTTPEPDPLTAALMAAAEAEAEAEGGAGRRGGGATPPLHPLQPVVKPKKRGRQARTKQNEHASGLPELKVIEDLLERYQSLLVRAEEEADGLRRLRSVADGWLEEARPVLEQDFVTDDQLELLNRLIAGGEGLGLHLEQVDILKANVEALLWARKVRALFGRLHLPEDEPALAQQAQQGGDAEDAEVADVLRRSVDLVSLAAGGQPFDERPPLSEAVALLEEGYILPCDEALYKRLNELVEAGRNFESRAAQVLMLARDGVSFANVIQVSELEPLLATAERLGLRLESLPILRGMLAGFRHWEAGARAITQDASGTPLKPSFAVLAQASSSAKSWPITSPVRAFIDEAVARTGDWMERCRKLLAKRNTGARLDVCLDAVAASVDGAVEQFERRLDQEKRLVASGQPGAGGVAPAQFSADDKSLYCLCQQTFHAATAMHTMIACDGCGDWFHSRCVGLSQSQMRGQRRFTCPICIAIKGNTDPLESCIAKLQRTKRPERDELAALQPELQRLPVQPREGEELDRLIKKFDRWATATSRAVEVHDMSRSVDSSGQVLPLSDGMLHQLLKSSLALEIDATEYADRVLRLLRCNKWRQRAEMAMGPPARQGLEGMQRLLDDADKLEINVRKDVTGVKLLAAMKEGREWAIRARAQVAELKDVKGDAAKFEACAKAAHELLAEGEKLKVKMEAEMEALKEHSKLFCLCQKPFDDATPMVSCANCKDLYHYRCVGLRVPGAAEGEGDDPPASFRCPLCCMRYGVKYAHFHKLPEASLDALKQAALKLPPPPPPAAAKPAQPSPAAGPGQSPAMAGLPLTGQAVAAHMAAMVAQMRPGATQTMQLPPGVTQEQVQAAFTHMQNMFQQVAQGGAMPTMVPGVGLVPFTPQMLAALQKAAAERIAAAQAAARQRASASPAGPPGSQPAAAAGGASGSKAAAKAGEQKEGAAGGKGEGAKKDRGPPKPRKRKKSGEQAAEGGAAAAAGAGGKKGEAAAGKAGKEGEKKTPKRRRVSAEQKAAAAAAAAAAGEGGEGQPAGGAAGEGASKPTKTATQRRRAGKTASQAAAEGGKAGTAEQATADQAPKQQQQQEAQQQQQPAAEQEEGGSGRAGGKRRPSTAAAQQPPASQGAAAPEEGGGSGGKPAKKKRRREAQLLQEGGVEAAPAGEDAGQAQEGGEGGGAAAARRRSARHRAPAAAPPPDSKHNKDQTSDESESEDSD